jgi:hypothetical protein
LLLGRPQWALRTAVFLRASVLAQGKADSRVSIGVGPVENVSTSRVSLSTGEAFYLSGQGLDDLTRNARMTIQIPRSTGPLAGWLPVVAQLCDAIIDRWSSRQAEVVALALHPDQPKHEKIASQLDPPVDRPVVTKTLMRAGFQSLEAAIEQFESEDWQPAAVD